MTETSNISVKLKPIFNIKPQIYIPIIYSVILLFILFLVTILPGIIKNGNNITITSTPSNAAIYVDNVRVGSTPLKYFLESKNKVITVKKDLFEDESKVIDIYSTIFLSLFRNNSEKIHINLKSDNGSEILKKAFVYGSKWSLINSSDISIRYQIPNLFSNSVLDYFSASDFDKDELDNYLKSSVKLITNESIFSDYLRAVAITSSGNRLPSISTIKNSSIFINKIISEQQHVPLLLYNKILINRISDNNSEYIKGLTEQHRTRINKNVISFEESKRDIKMGNITFKNVPKSQITPIDVNFIHSIQNDSFYISEFMVSNESYFDFIKDNPKWSIDNYKNLLEEGLIDKYYLDFSTEEDYITNISYYAAKEWCNWANNKYNVPEGYKIILPSENMWFSATQYGVVKNIDAWQWTSQGFFLYDHFLTDDKGKPLISFTDIEQRLVVGKNKYNTKAESSRGVQDANWCTPFISFRPALVKE